MQAYSKFGFIVLSLALAATGCGEKSESELLTSARSYLDKNDPKAAAIQLKNVLQQQPSSAEARFLLGKALLETATRPVPKSSCAARWNWGSRGHRGPAAGQGAAALGQHDKLIKQFVEAELATRKPWSSCTWRWPKPTRRRRNRKGKGGRPEGAGAPPQCGRRR